MQTLQGVDFVVKDEIIYIILFLVVIFRFLGQLETLLHPHCGPKPRH